MRKLACKEYRGRHPRQQQLLLSSFFEKKKAAALSLKSRDIFCVAPNCSRKSPGNGKERNITLLLSKIQNSGVHGRDSGTCKDNHF